MDLRAPLLKKMCFNEQSSDLEKNPSRTTIRVSAPTNPSVPTAIPHTQPRKCHLYLGNIPVKFQKDWNKTSLVIVWTRTCHHSPIFLLSQNLKYKNTNSAKPVTYIKQPSKRSNCIKFPSFNLKYNFANAKMLKSFFCLSCLYLMSCVKVKVTN